MIGPPGAPVEEPYEGTFDTESNFCRASARIEKTYSFTNADENKRSTSLQTHDL